MFLGKSVTTSEKLLFSAKLYAHSANLQKNGFQEIITQ